MIKAFVDINKKNINFSDDFFLRKEENVKKEVIWNFPTSKKKVTKIVRRKA